MIFDKHARARMFHPAAVKRGSMPMNDYLGLVRKISLI